MADGNISILKPIIGILSDEKYSISCGQCDLSIVIQTDSLTLLVTVSRRSDHLTYSLK